MSEKLLYLDSSAIVKLILPEPETDTLFQLLHGYPERVTSAVSRVEVLRAVKRAEEEKQRLRRAEEVLARLGLIRVDLEVLETAAKLGPESLRSLAAIHLATALSLEEQLGAMVVYDKRLSDAAKANGIDVLAPA